MFQYSVWTAIRIIGQIAIDAHIIIIYLPRSYHTAEGMHGTATDRHDGNIVFPPFRQVVTFFFVDARSRRVGNRKTAPGLVAEITLVQRNGVSWIYRRRVVESCLETLACLYYGLRVGVSQYQRKQEVGTILCHTAAHVHRAVVVDIEGRALALQRRGGLHIQQVGVGVRLQPLVVLTDEGIINGTGRDEQPTHGVAGTLHLAEHRLQIGQALRLALGCQLQGAHTILLGSHLDAFVDQVVVRAVAQAVRAVDYRHKRCRGGLLLVGIGLIDGIALLGAARQQQAGQ